MEGMGLGMEMGVGEWGERNGDGRSEDLGKQDGDGCRAVGTGEWGWKERGFGKMEMEMGVGEWGQRNRDGGNGNGRNGIGEIG